MPRTPLAQLAEAAFLPGAGAGALRVGRGERARAKGGGYTGYVTTAAGERTDADGRTLARPPTGSLAVAVDELRFGRLTLSVRERGRERQRDT